jgi:hypothetical protein
VTATLNDFDRNNNKDDKHPVVIKVIALLFNLLKNRDIFSTITKALDMRIFFIVNVAIFINRLTVEST